MNNAKRPEADWQQLFESALQEHEPVMAAERFQNAKDAIMDRIEDCFDTASQSERRLLLAALNTIGELERSAADPSARPSASRTLGHVA